MNNLPTRTRFSGPILDLKPNRPNRFAAYMARQLRDPTVWAVYLAVAGTMIITRLQQAGHWW